MNLEKQKLLLEYALSNPDLFAKVNHIIKTSYMDIHLQRPLKFVKDYYDKYRQLPNADQIAVETGTTLDTSKVLVRSELSYTENELESFCRQKAIEEAILASPALIDKGDYSSVEKMIKDAISVGLIKNVGLDYFLDPEDRIKRYLTLNNMISTGWDELDNQLNGGLNRKEMTLFAGLPGCITANETVRVYISQFSYDHRDIVEYTDDGRVIRHDVWANSTDIPNVMHILSNHQHMELYNVFMNRKELLDTADIDFDPCVRTSSEWLKTIFNQLADAHAVDITIPELIEKHADKMIFIDTPDGWQQMSDLVIKPKIACYRIVTVTGHCIEVAENHLVECFRWDDSGHLNYEHLDWIPAKDLKVGMKVFTRDGADTIETVTRIEDQKVYDLSVMHHKHRYWGGSGISSHNTGKSLFLANSSVNMLMRGLNVIYITLELSEEVVAKRFDSIVSGVGQSEILKNINLVATEITNKASQWGKLFIKRMPESTTCANHIRAYLKEFELMNGIVPDVIVIDYLDLMSPNSKVSAEAIFIKDKYVSEEVRSIANEYDCIVLSASQFGRGGYQSAEKSDQSSDNIAGGISKVNTCDNLFAIIQSETMKTKGEYILKLLKTRSSSGVGSFVNLSWDNISLRIGNVRSDAKLGRSNFKFDRNKDDPSALILGEEEAAKIAENTPKKPAFMNGKKDLSSLMDM